MSTRGAWFPRALRAGMAALFLGTGMSAMAQTAPAGGAARATDYVRVVEEDQGNRIKLQTSSRSFKARDGGGPDVHLVGVMHIGDRAYYESLQAFLDRWDVVLYEGVKPSGAGESAMMAPDFQSRRALTRQRLRLLAMFVERSKRATGSYPVSIEAMVKDLPRMQSRMAKGAAVDAWGTPITIVEMGKPGDEPGKPGVVSFDLVSAGADKQPGGEGEDADIRFSEQKPLTKAEIESTQEGIQVKMASALGLEFQLMAIDYGRPNWRNSDLSVDAVQKKLADAGASGEALFKMLDGSSLSAKFAGILLNLVKSSRQSQAMGKLMMIEMLGSADELMASGAGGAGAMMQVIVIDRNQAVFDDLRSIMEREKNVRSVALFYGSGHIADLEKRLTDLGYEFTGEEWFSGIDMDLNASGIDAAQAKSLRQMIRRTVDEQIKAASKLTKGAAGGAGPDADKAE